MVARRRGTVYGIGCITEKETHAGRVYLYAEWSLRGRRHCESCGSAADPKSRELALDKLRAATLERVAALRKEIAGLQAALETGA